MYHEVHDLTHIVLDERLICIMLNEFGYLDVLLELFKRQKERLLVEEVRLQDHGSQLSHLRLLVQVVHDRGLIEELKDRLVQLEQRVEGGLLYLGLTIRESAGL